MNLNARSRSLYVALLVFGLAVPAGAAPNSFQTPIIHSGVLLNDDTTLVVSCPSAGTLIYFDTVEEKELRRVEVDFQPAAMAVHGDKLIVAAKGASILHVLEAATGKEVREVRLPGEPVRAIAAHPTKGLVYAVNLSNEVFSLDPAKGSAVKTAAKGQLIAVPADDGGSVFTGIQAAISDQLVIQEGPNKRLTVSLGQANTRAVMLKYAVAGTDLKLTGANDNAALNGLGLGVSPDGKRVAMAGGGGWQSKADPKFNYVIAVFDAADMMTMLGQVDTGPYPSEILFHPKLSLGVAYNASKLLVFNGKSLVKRETFKVTHATGGGLLAFVARGTKIAYGSKPGFGDKTESTLEFFPLTLTDRDREALKAGPKK